MKPIFILIALSQYLSAVSYEAGLALIEEQDSRLSPALTLGIEGESFGSRFYSLGQSIGGYERRAHILSLYPGPIVINESWKARIGMALSRMHYQYRSEKAEDSYNVGALFGIGYQWGMVRVNYDSHIYLAGLSGLFFVTGRQQALSLGLGWTW